MTDAYDLGDALSGQGVEELHAGTNLAVVGPAMAGKRELAIRLLTAGAADVEGILYVSTDGKAGRALEDLERHAPSLDRDRLAILDCSGNAGRELPDTRTEIVGSPGDLTGTSIGMAKLMQSLAEAGRERVRHGLVSVSTLLQYLDADTVFKFLHVYTARVDDTGGLGVFTLDDGAHATQDVNTILGQFDGVVELEPGGGEPSVHLRGFSRQSTR